MADEKQTVLIIEDDLDVADMLNAYFRVQGYEVLTVNWGEDGIKAAQSSQPNLIILDIRLPDIDGFAVAEAIRTNRRTEHIPIIFLTEKRHRDDRLKGLELGADDYITKPFDIQELRLRVRNSLRRSSQGALSNPITNLPEGAMVDDRLADLLTADSDWAVMLVTVGNWEAFREAYGFVASDDVLRAVSLMVQNSLRDEGSESDFLGHFSPTEFILITTPDHVANLTDRISNRLAQSIDYFYPVKDREADSPIPNRLHIKVTELDRAAAHSLQDLDSLKTALVRKLA